MGNDYDICVVGGCGHVGLPLGLTFSQAGLRVAALDTNDEKVAMVASGRVPFREAGAEDVLRDVLASTFFVANNPSLVSLARFVVVVIGTPVDEHLNPTFHTMKRVIAELVPHLRDGQCLILRSTVYPGTTEKIRDYLVEAGLKISVAFCPERVAEGKAMEELTSLPQIVAGTDDFAYEQASWLFGKISRTILRLTPLEAELTKIFANVWRYIQFATANQFFMLATEFNLDFYHIHDALTRDYPRMQGLPTAGFAAGPCLFKDTMQLAAAAENVFSLGHSAMLINEGLPNFVVKKIKQKYPLATMTVGLLGMAFKADSDDPRESLSYKLRKILEYEAKACLCTDEFVRDERFLPLLEVVHRSDLLIVGAPHSSYREIVLPEGIPLIDIWNLYGRGALGI